MISKWREKYYRECDEIDAECRLRMKDGERVYREGDITEKLSNLMGRDLVRAAIEECLDQLNYTRALIVKLRRIEGALENDRAVQRVLPSGKPKVATQNVGATCELNA